MYDTIRKVVEQEPVNPRLHDPTVDRDLAAIALKCLEKDPAKRYESAAALADDLDRWRAGEATQARPLSLGGQAWRWLKRNTGATAVVVLLGIFWGFAAGLLDYGSDSATTLLPSASASPLGWYRAVHASPGLYVVLSLAFTGLTLGIGWVLVRATRPKTPRAALGYAIATGLFAVLASGLTEGPFLADRFAQGGAFRVHPIEPGAAPSAAEAAYLESYMASDKRDPAHPDYAAELKEVHTQAVRVNRLNALVCGLWLAAAISILLHLGWTALSTWAVDYLDRARGRRWSNVILYAEMTFPAGLALLLGITVTLDSDPDFIDTSDHSAWQLFGTMFGYFVVLATIGLVGVLRRWPWWVRWLLYFGVSFLAFFVLVLLAMKFTVEA